MSNEKKKTFTCIIPVRFASTRFPGKPLKKIDGKEMLLHVFENAQASGKISNVLVAAYDEKIESFCKENDISVVRVSEEVKNGSEAVADASKSVNEDYIFELQGDQPLVTPEIINDFLSRAWEMLEENSDADLVHPYAECDEECTQSEDVLKAVVSEGGRILFQTRQSIQTGKRTLGLYLWKKESLLRFASLPEHPVEKAEKSHPVRLYMNDFYVQGISIDWSDWVEVDREHHIKEVEKIIKKSQ